MDLDAVFFAIPFFFLAMAIEYFWGRKLRRKIYRFNDTITNLNIGVGSQVFGLFSKIVLIGVYVFAYEHWAIFQIQNSAWSFIACLVLFDFLYYWAHRWSHSMNFLWGAHVVHHSSEEFNLAVALRQSWIHSLLAFFIFLPLPLLGFSTEVFLAAGAVITLYQFWVHTELIDKMPVWFEFVFNSPSHHRVHHATNKQYIDRNHAAIFIIWDRMFGTFAREVESPQYGLTKPLKSWNPFWANLHHYVDMLDTWKSCELWIDKVLLPFRKPDWQAVKNKPQGSALAFSKYDQKARPSHQLYILIQFILISFGLMAYTYFFESLGLGFQILFLAIILSSTLICGALLEQKAWVKKVEWARLILIALSLDWLYYLQYVDWFHVMLLSSSVVLIVLIVMLYGKQSTISAT
jgi:sterol desaturase/sphingolipid hydroxylase (fatty acid hydroxylase superfamily)